MLVCAFQRGSQSGTQVRRETSHHRLARLRSPHLRITQPPNRASFRRRALTPLTHLMSPWVYPNRFPLSATRSLLLSHNLTLCLSIAPPAGSRRTTTSRFPSPRHPDTNSSNISSSSRRGWPATGTRSRDNTTIPVLWRPTSNRHTVRGKGAFSAWCLPFCCVFLCRFLPLYPSVSSSGAERERAGVCVCVCVCVRVCAASTFPWERRPQQLWRHISSRHTVGFSLHVCFRVCVCSGVCSAPCLLPSSFTPLSLFPFFFLFGVSLGPEGCGYAQQAQY